MQFSRLNKFNINTLQFINIFYNVYLLYIFDMFPIRNNRSFVPELAENILSY